MNIVGLLLAAGSASRFGSDKLRHALPHGVPIAVQAARNLKSELARVIVVVRAAETARVFAAERCESAVCENAHEGMGASLACAVRAAGKADGYLVALADMPFVRPTTIAAVRDALAAGARLAAPYFHARRGHPADDVAQTIVVLWSAFADPSFSGREGLVHHVVETFLAAFDRDVVRAHLDAAVARRVADRNVTDAEREVTRRGRI